MVSLCKDDLSKTVCKRVAAVEGEQMPYKGNGKNRLWSPFSGGGRDVSLVRCYVSHGARASRSRLATR